MNFFKAQERARVTSRWLIVWFSLALIGVVASFYAVAVIAKSLWVMGNSGQLAPIVWLDPILAVYIGPIAGGLIIFGSLNKITQLSAGGSVVARDLGGRPVHPSTTDPLERRLIHVVEEMAIASGLPAPQAWILDDEDGINAFAAGTDPTNAVIGVTRGCLERFTRDELQGVVAHEFSHILNGDMKLNMRLTGWIFGLVMFAVFGRVLFRVVRHTRIFSESSKASAVVLLIGAAGAAAWLIGSIGAIFARLMQAAVSRQREYLADASAVQFTRNPSGITDALKKIGGFDRHAAIQSSGASEARHFFFASSDFMNFGLGTHPPLKRRIRALQPGWNGQFLQSERQITVKPPRDKNAVVSQLTGEPIARLVPASASFALDSLAESERLDPRVGSVIRRQLQRANVGFHSKDDAKALLYGLLLAQDGAGHDRALALLIETAGQETADAANEWHRQLASRSAAEKLALIDISLPWLRRMGRDEASEFLQLNRALIAADDEICLFEFMLERVLERHVAVGLALRPVARIHYRSLADLHRETAVLLGAFAGQSGDPSALDTAADEFQQHTGMALEMLPPAACTLDLVTEALTRFEMSTPLVKARILRLCGLVAIADGVLKDGEVELLRAAADAIGAPVPPLSSVGDDW